MTFNKFVMVCSPYRGEVERNLNYARAACRDALLRGESVFVPHLTYTQEGVLDDNIEHERKAGMQAGIKMMHKLDALAVYKDLGVSEGMSAEIERAEALGLEIEYRCVPGWQ